MYSTLSRIVEVFPLFNIKPITENDFWRACKKRKVIVCELPLLVNGYYERRKGREYILINNRLTGLPWLHTALHEFCHVLCDEPFMAENHALYKRIGIASADPRERFADAFALIGLLPYPGLIEMVEGGVDDALQEVYEARIEVWRTYGL